MCALRKTSKPLQRAVPGWRSAALVATLFLAIGPAGCALAPRDFGGHWWMSSHECLARVMYFESNRSSDAGMLAVGTVVMNRVRSNKFPNTVCAVVGQPRQFAPGALDKPMNGPGRARAERMATAVLLGARHPGVGRAMFFHTAGVQFPYHNMHYVLVAGGNAFYEKTNGNNARRWPGFFGWQQRRFGWQQRRYEEPDRLAFLIRHDGGL